MKLAIVALVVSAAVASQGAEINNKPGYKYQHRAIVGHFKEQPLIDLYRVYAVAFNLNKDLSKDDYRRYTPSASECMHFLNRYRRDNYKENEILEFVMVDACLGYLYESQYHERDMDESIEVRKKLPLFIADDNLRTLFNGTQIESALSYEAKACVANLFTNLALVRSQFEPEQRHTNWIQVLLNFASCHKEIPDWLREKDTYVKRIYELVREAAEHCYENEYHSINEAVSNSCKGPVRLVKGKLLGTSNKSDRMWPPEIVSLLGVIQRAKNKKDISLRKVHTLLRSYYNNDSNKDDFLKNLAHHASKSISPKDLKNDPDGSQSYKREVDKLCFFFRSSDSKKSHDFSKSFVRLIELLNHEDIFGLTHEKFLEDIVREAGGAAALYLCISACNIMSFTEISIERPSSGYKVFKVHTQFDTRAMVRWPDAGYY